MDPRQAHLIYEFGEFRLDALRRVLSSRADGQPLPVTGRVLDTLLYFVERAGQLLDKGTLMEALWPNVVVEESNLTQTIHALRRVLGERPEEHRFIVTVPGRGYRFVADVRATAVAEPEPAVTEAIGKADKPPRRWRPFALAALSFAILAALLFFSLRPGETPQTPRSPSTPSVAVLPFVDMSPEGNQAYFSDGLSEEILNLLAQSPALRVIARTSSFSFKDQTADIATIADKLHVTHVLEGSVRKSGDQIRITAQLVDGATSAHVWSETYDRDLRDVFAVQTDIAASVAESLQVTLTGDERPRPGETNSTQAFERYLQGRYFFNRRGVSDLERARNYFEQAVQIDPGYARAWAGLAGVYSVAHGEGQPMPDGAWGKWHEAVERAIALGPNLAEVHVRAAGYFWLTGNSRQGDEHFNRAVQLNPSEPLVLGILSNEFLLEGRLNEAISLKRRLVAIDPLSAVNRHNLAVYLVAAGRWDEAKLELEKALELSPNEADFKAEITRILVLQERFDEALALAQQLPESEKRDQCLALVYHATGQAAAADAALARLIARAGRDSNAVAKLLIAEVHAFRGNAAAAFKWIALADRQSRTGPGVDQGWEVKTELMLSPFLKPLRSDPRWPPLFASAENP